MVKIMKWDSPASSIFVESNHHQPLPVQSSIMATICCWFSIKEEKCWGSKSTKNCPKYSKRSQSPNTQLFLGWHETTSENPKSRVILIWLTKQLRMTPLRTHGFRLWEQASDGRCCPRQNQQNGGWWLNHAPLSTIPVRPVNAVVGKCKKCKSNHQPLIINNTQQYSTMINGGNDWNTYIINHQLSKMILEHLPLTIINNTQQWSTTIGSSLVV